MERDSAEASDALAHGAGTKSACSPLLLVANLRSHALAERGEGLTGLCWAHTLGVQRLHGRMWLQPEVFLPLNHMIQEILL